MGLSTTAYWPANRKNSFGTCRSGLLSHPDGTMTEICSVAGRLWYAPSIVIDSDESIWYNEAGHVKRVDNSGTLMKDIAIANLPSSGMGSACTLDDREYIYVIGQTVTRKLYCYDKAGNLVWDYAFPTGISPNRLLIDSNNNVYVSETSYSVACGVRKISSSGSLVWDAPVAVIGAGIYEMAFLPNEAGVVCSLITGVVKCINTSSGSILWTATAGTSPIITSIGNVYTAHDNKIYYINGSDGSIIWTWTSPDGNDNFVNSRHALMSNDTVVVSTSGDSSGTINVYAVDINKNTVWSKSISDPEMYQDSGIVCDRNNNTFFAAGTTLYGVDKDGTQFFALNTGYYCLQSLTIGSNGNIWTIGTANTSTYKLLKFPSDAVQPPQSSGVVNFPTMIVNDNSRRGIGISTTNGSVNWE